jgi:hypothetical protein
MTLNTDIIADPGRGQELSMPGAYILPPTYGCALGIRYQNDKVTG